jgi:hypothetical protein
MSIETGSSLHRWQVFKAWAPHSAYPVRGDELKRHDASTVTGLRLELCFGSSMTRPADAVLAAPCAAWRKAPRNGLSGGVPVGVRPDQVRYFRSRGVSGLPMQMPLLPIFDR